MGQERGYRGDWDEHLSICVRQMGMMQARETSTMRLIWAMNSKICNITCFKNQDNGAYK